jgi:hypothetical protein
MEKINLIVICPHCQELVLIEQLNCRIFRHAIFKSNGQQINPHAPKIECDQLVKENKVYGCGKPFQINDELIAIGCDYI